MATQKKPAAKTAKSSADAFMDELTTTEAPKTAKAKSENTQPSYTVKRREDTNQDRKSVV